MTSQTTHFTSSKQARTYDAELLIRGSAALRRDDDDDAANSDDGAARDSQPQGSEPLTGTARFPSAARSILEESQVV
ncbi:hypothetical protein GN956_G3941 [Arapaima gigas]